MRCFKAKKFREKWVLDSLYYMQFANFSPSKGDDDDDDIYYRYLYISKL